MTEQDRVLRFHGHNQRPKGCRNLPPSRHDAGGSSRRLDDGTSDGHARRIWLGLEVVSKGRVEGLKILCGSAHDE